MLLLLGRHLLMTVVIIVKELTQPLILFAQVIALHVTLANFDLPEKNQFKFKTLGAII